MAEFLRMGGYAAYVWPAYAITAIVLVLSGWSARRHRDLQRAAAKRRASGARETVR